MWHIVITLCSIIANPAGCRDENLMFQDDSTGVVAMCGVGAQAEVARFMEAHPKHYVAQWKCRMGPPHQEAKI